MYDPMLLEHSLKALENISEMKASLRTMERLHQQAIETIVEKASDPAELYALYCSHDKVRKFIRSKLLIEVDGLANDEWYIRLYGNTPNALFSILLDEHPREAFRSIVAMIANIETREAFYALTLHTSDVSLKDAMEKCLDDFFESYWEDEIQPTPAGLVLAWVYQERKEFHPLIEKRLKELRGDDPEAAAPLENAFSDALQQQAKEQLSLFS